MGRSIDGVVVPGAYTLSGVREYVIRERYVPGCSPFGKCQRSCGLVVHSSSGVSLILGTLYLVYIIRRRISVQAEYVIECVLVLCCSYLCGASVFVTFSLISNEVDL